MNGYSSNNFKWYKTKGDYFGSIHFNTDQGFMNLTARMNHLAGTVPDHATRSSSRLLTRRLPELSLEMRS
jgi:catalase